MGFAYIFIVRQRILITVISFINSKSNFIFSRMPSQQPGLQPSARSPSHFWVVSLCLWPAGHLHSKEPTVLIQFPPWHNPGMAWHSSTSARRKHFQHKQNWFPDYISMFLLCTRENAALQTTGWGRQTLYTHAWYSAYVDVFWRPTCAVDNLLCCCATKCCLLSALLVLALSLSHGSQHKVNVPSVFPYEAQWVWTLRIERHTISLSAANTGQKSCMGRTYTHYK